MIFPKLYQAVKFIYGNYIGYGAEQENCNQCYAPPYCQMVEPDDTTKFQLGICDFEDKELVQDGDFSIADNWSVTGGWAIDTGTPQAENNSGVAGVLSQQVDITAGNTYFVKFRNGFNDNGSGNSLFVRLGGTLVKDIKLSNPPEEGVWAIAVTLEAPLTDSLISFETEANVETEIHDVSIIEAPCAVRQLVDNPTFNDPGTEWTYENGWSYNADDGTGVSGSAVFNGGGQGGLSQSLPLLKAGCMYRVHFDLLDNSLEDPLEIEVRLGGNAIYTIDENTPTGETIIYYFMESMTQDWIEFYADSGLDAEIDNIYVFELSGAAYDLRNDEGVSVLAAVGEHVGTIAQGEIAWSGLAEDCYNICAYDLCPAKANLLINGGFDNSNIWNVSGEWGIAAGTANVNGTGPGELDQAVTLKAKTLYRVSWDLVAFGTMGATVDVNFNGQKISELGVDGTAGRYSYLVVVDTVVDGKIEFSINDNGMTLQVTLDDVKVEQLTGCGAEENVTNGTFDNDSDWSKGGNWVISGGTASNSVPTASDVLQQTVSLLPSTEYEISVEMVSHVSPFNVLKVIFDDVIIFTIDTTTDPDGVYSAVFTTKEVINSNRIKLDVAINNGMTIDNVSIKSVSDGVVNCGEIFCSECFVLKDEHDCSVLLQWTNPKNTMGFNYEDFDFVQSLRLEGLVRRPTMPQDFNVQVTQSNGTREQIAVRSRIQEQFVISQVPAYIHEAVESGANHMEFSINGVEYIRIPGDYAPNWRDRSLVAPAILDVQKKKQPNREMTNC